MNTDQFYPILIVVAAACGGCGGNDRTMPAQTQKATADQSTPAAAPKIVPVEDTQRATISLLTFKISADPRHADQRFSKIMELLRDSDADVIALQEAPNAFFDVLETQEWTQKYQVCTTTRDGLWYAPGGQFVLSKFPIEESKDFMLPSDEARSLVWIYLRLNGRRLAVATTHLEAGPNEDDLRGQQLDTIFKAFDAADDYILLGNFAIGDEPAPLNEQIERRFADAWRRLRPADPGHTLDFARNAPLRASKTKERNGRRADRILVQSARWIPKSIRLMGAEAAANDQPDGFPSRHFGVWCELAWR